MCYAFTTARTSRVRRGLKRDEKERKKKQKNRKYRKTKQKNISYGTKCTKRALYLLFSQKSKDLSNRKSSWNAQEAHTREKYILLYKYIWDIKKELLVYLAVIRMLHCLTVCSIQIQMYYCIRWSIIYQNI